MWHLHLEKERMENTQTSLFWGTGYCLLCSASEWNFENQWCLLFPWNCYILTKSCWLTHPVFRYVNPRWLLQLVSLYVNYLLTPEIITTAVLVWILTQREKHQFLRAPGVEIWVTGWLLKAHRGLLWDIMNTQAAVVFVLQHMLFWILSKCYIKNYPKSKRVVGIKVESHESRWPNGSWLAHWMLSSQNDDNVGRY